MPDAPSAVLVTPTAPIAADTHGGRAKCLQRLVRLELPVPRTVALSFDAVRAIAEGQMPAMSAIGEVFESDALLCVRPSSQDPDWGGPGAVLNVGMNEARFAALAAEIGRDAAAALYLRFVQAYAVHVARLDADLFEGVEEAGEAGLRLALRLYEEEAEEPFPQSREAQLAHVLTSMARAWQGTTARLLRQARGAPADAGLGLIVQEMVQGFGARDSGAGVAQLIDPETGLYRVTGRFQWQGQHREALSGGQGGAVLYLVRDARGPSMEEALPEVFDQLKGHLERMRRRLREDMQAEFAVAAGRLYILDAIPAPRSNRAAIRVAVRLAEDEVISREEAILRVEPRALGEMLHRQVDPAARRDVIGRGVAASPGAATGRIVFTSEAAQAAAARDEPCILVRRETTPEDVRGMHAASGVLTERGGMSSHAAVIGRGLGLPCVVGASGMTFRVQERELVAEDGRVFRAGDVITIDGSRGEVLAGAPPLTEPVLDESMQRLMAWADQVRELEVRANADTPEDARMAMHFKADGIGLCRTEHMFFEADRLTVMREMIFAETEADRRAALELLLPMQRADFIELFRIMKGRPVCIRLLDPPLHEFLPADKAGMRALAEALDRPVSEVTRRVEALSEYNPMLGMRGVRLGVVMPEIYEMQARAIFEAVVEAAREGAPVVPEIMLPLVSARREVELVNIRIDAVAAEVRARTGADFDYRLGVMVETPRAALRAGDIAPHVSFLSFGTNDLTQMTYGLSRDDAGRFMSAYVQEGVFAEDPFRTLDEEGVGELLHMAVERARGARPDIVLSLCGEHGGSPQSVTFCHAAGFDYVSCSPYRVPIARLAAAQSAIRARGEAHGGEGQVATGDISR